MSKREEMDAKWGWLASIVATFVIAGFRVLESLFRTVFQILQMLAAR